ncbi:MAG: ArdC-like ssDNA-binding domain-containing protein [Burkholderiales bacterium]
MNIPDSATANQHASNNDAGATPKKANWAELLVEAVKTPGMISQAYSAFHAYSTGNQILALMQCIQRGIAPGPLNTFPGWKKLGRNVRKGQKAIWLCMPLSIKRKADDARDSEDERQATIFVFKPHWFVMEQTEGDAVPMPDMPEWDIDRALDRLEIRRVPFTSLNGNAMGYAKDQEIAISPLAPLPWKTLFHEMAHCALGHTSEGALTDGTQTPRNLREVEAEAVALLCCDSLGLEGGDYCRGYIQSWLEGDVIPEKSAQKIFRSADLILRAGRAA